MDLEAQGPSERAPNTEPGMNIISADFDLIMVNRPNERLYGKPMVELLGKKCYREFEKRDEPCSHCPGRRSLMTGGTHEAETEGLRDDGTWFSARVRTYPVHGPGESAAGFVEVVEDITEEKRAEKLGRIEGDLRSALLSVQNVRKALALAFTAALRVESIDMGGVFLHGTCAPEQQVVVSRSLSDECLRAVTARLAGGAGSDGSGEKNGWEDVFSGLPGAPRSLAIVPVVHKGETAATIVAGSSTYPSIPSSLLAGLRGLGATVTDTISRIWAEQLRGDAVADLESIITYAPVAAFVLDGEGRTLMWNRAAERLFGWKAAEVLKEACPFPEVNAQAAGLNALPVEREAVLTAKDGRPIDVRLVISGFRDVIGVAATTVVMVQDLTSLKRLEELECRLHALEERESLRMDEEPEPSTVLLLGIPAQKGDDLWSALECSGYEVRQCLAPQDAAEVLQADERERTRVALAVVELIPETGPDGLAQKAALRSMGLQVPVVVCSDAEVRGYREHGFAASITRPYSEEQVRRALREALEQELVASV